MKLPQDTIDQAYRFTREDVEVCGFIVDRKHLRIDVRGDRNSCQHSQYAPHVFHTHPLRSGSYPSSSDIIKLLKLRKYPEVGVIFTQWGVWEFSCHKKQALSESQVEELYDSIKRAYAPLRNNYFYANMNNEVEKAISDCNYALMKSLQAFDFEIYFTTWEEFNENGFKII